MATKRRLRIAAVVGARPNLMKMAPLMEAMAARSGVEPVLIHTGQHYDARMSGLFFEQLGIPAPDHYLGIGSGSHGEQTGRMMQALEPLFEELAPDVVLVVGDVNSTLAAAVVAAKLRVPIAHVEAGLRSFDRDMPEEINRVLTDAVADFLFVTERSGVENLRREGVDEARIFLVGNVMIDTLRRHRERARALNVPARFGLEPGGYAVATLHRPSNVDTGEGLERARRILTGAAERLPVIFPVHPRTTARLRATGWPPGAESGTEGIGRAGARRSELSHAAPALRLVEPLGYLEFLGLMAEARVVLTDSGGIQEETTALGVPCLTVRDNTERPVTIEAGTNRLVGTDPERVLAALDAALEHGHGAARVPELWDGHAAGRIVETLAEALATAH